MKPEEKARQDIDELLEAGGWNVQDYKDLNLEASLGVVVRDFPLESDRSIHTKRYSRLGWKHCEEPGQGVK